MFESALAVLHVGVGPVAPAGSLAVPTSIRVLPLDRFALAGHALLRGGGLGGGERRRMAWERFGKHAVDLVGPAAVVFDNLVGDVGHARTSRSGTLECRGYNEM